MNGRKSKKTVISVNFRWPTDLSTVQFVFKCLAGVYEYGLNQFQGGHIPAKIKFPVFSLSFPCVR